MIVSHPELYHLLNKHVSPVQMIAFATANVMGMLLLIAAVQFYRDISPLFVSGNGIMKSDYIVVTKKVSTFSMLKSSEQGFSDTEIDNLKRQSFVDDLGVFTPSHFGVQAIVSIPDGRQYGTEMFFESVPDQYVDVKTKRWKWKSGDREIPIVLPRSYLNLYNFGFAQTRGLPKLSEEAMAVLPFSIFITTPIHRYDEFNAHIVGFSNRLNTILVPEDFLAWANSHYGDRKSHQPSRLILKTSNPADATLVQYFKKHKLLAEQDNLDTGRMAWFLRVIIGIVLAIGGIICALAFYILMLSVFLLVQKNREKLKTLRLIGYSVREVSLPYTLMTVALNTIVLSLAWAIFLYVRDYYIETLSEIYTEIEGVAVYPTIALSLVVLVLLSLMNSIIIHRKINAIK